MNIQYGDYSVTVDLEFADVEGKETVEEAITDIDRAINEYNGIIVKTSIKQYTGYCHQCETAEPVEKLNIILGNYYCADCVEELKLAVGDLIERERIVNAANEQRG